MNRFEQKLLTWNFKRIALSLVAVVVAVAVAGGVFFFQSLRPKVLAVREEMYQSYQTEYDRYDGFADGQQGQAGQTGQDEGNTQVLPRGRYRVSPYQRYRGGCGSRRIDPIVRRSRRSIGRELVSRLDLSTGDRIALAAFCVTGGLLALAIRLLFPLWIWQKGLLAGVNPLPWAILTLLCIPVGIFGFFVYRSFQNRCPNCGTRQPKENSHCTRCGHPLQESCTNCGSPVNSKDQYCGSCGKPRQ